MSITRIPNEVLDLPLSTTAMVVYIRLLRRWPEGKFNASADEMAEICQVSRPTVCRALDELTEAGLFESKMRLKVSFEN